MPFLWYKHGKICKKLTDCFIFVIETYYIM